MPDRAPPPEGYVVEVRDRLASARGVNLGYIFGLLVGIDAVVMIALLSVMGPQFLPVALLVLFAFPILIFGLITQILWQPHARRHPARPQAADAVVRLYQSVAFGRAGRINNFVHVAADADHLHLIAPGVMRLTGARVISIPWDRFTDVKQKGLFGITRGRVDGRFFAAPTWCMQVALAQAQTDLTAERVGVGEDSDGSIRIN